ncbi:MAG: polysulfide reductase NrfD [candidate division Zixibacteria bacterium]|nr:polysulfide reductase NrfD [candidate division Zixibacteria bacterium]
MNRVKTFKTILWAITGLAVAFGAARMIFGLGAVSNLSDATPWGIWKGLNVVPGIALAAGGFVVTAVIYIMRREEFHRYAKITVLLAFLGYITAATALVAELGLPWMVWHPIIYWQHHSALFEVSWCVMLYLTVLFLEFLPTPLESTGSLAAIRRFLTKYKLVLVFLGVMISTLHQSSLGTMFLITPDKLHGLWYSSLLPILFFVSAVAVGPLMLILAVLTISALYRKPIETDILAKLAGASAIVLGLFGLIRLIDLAANGKLGLAFDGSGSAVVFLIEFTIGVLLPVAILSVKRLRRSQAGLWVAAIAGVMGIGLHRANIAGIQLVHTGPTYVPTIYEIGISLGIISAAILAFLFCVERFRMWETPWEDPRQAPEAAPEFDRVADVWLGTPRIAGRTVYSLVFIVALAAGLAIVSTDRIESSGIKEVRAVPARGGDTLFVDGNLDGYGVSFAHKAHVDREGGNASCSRCHHMSLPHDQQSGCATCHSGMYTAADVFRHDWHAGPDGGNLTCNMCHATDRERSAESAKTCDECHKDLIPTNAQITVKQYMAPSYTDAMHGVCIQCHEQKAQQLAGKESLARCATCHGQRQTEYLPAGVYEQFRDTSFNRVITPPMATGGQSDGKDAE